MDCHPKKVTISGSSTVFLPPVFDFRKGLREKRPRKREQ